MPTDPDAPDHPPPEVAAYLELIDALEARVAELEANNATLVASYNELAARYNQLLGTVKDVPVYVRADGDG